MRPILSLLVIILLGLPPAGPVRADDSDIVPELPASPHPYGHPMLLYLKSSKPFPEAHARCLRHIERRVDRLYGYWSSYSISEDMTFLKKTLTILENTVRGDWGILQGNRVKECGPGKGIVIPAKAGIQGVHTQSFRDSWIPAFAGMTAKYLLRDIFRSTVKDHCPSPDCPRASCLTTAMPT